MDDGIYQSNAEYANNERFQASNPGDQVKNRYDMPTPLVTDLQQRDVRAITVIDLNLTQPFNETNRQIDGYPSYNLKIPGRGFVIYMWDTATNLPLNVSQFIRARIGFDNQEVEFPACSGRGFRGDFTNLFLRWDFSGDTYKAKMVLFHFDAQPYTGVI